MRKRSQAFASSVGVIAVAAVIAACGGSSSSGGGTGKSGGSTSLSSGTQGINPGSGSPKSGGTLNMLGQGDVDYMDPNISYYTIGYLGQRPWIRGLYAYPATTNASGTTKAQRTSPNRVKHSAAIAFAIPETAFLIAFSLISDSLIIVPSTTSSRTPAAAPK